MYRYLLILITLGLIVTFSYYLYKELTKFGKISIWFKALNLKKGDYWIHQNEDPFKNNSVIVVDIKGEYVKFLRGINQFDSMKFSQFVTQYNPIEDPTQIYPHVGETWLGKENNPFEPNQGVKVTKIKSDWIELKSPNGKVTQLTQTQLHKNYKPEQIEL